MNQTKEATYRKAFGKRLAGLRHDNGYTQEQLAERAGLAVLTVAAIEQGRRWASLTTLHRLAKSLNIPTDELFKDLKR